MASKRVETVLTITVGILAVAAVASRALEPSDPGRAVSPKDEAFEQRYQKAQDEKREQERALYCAGRPESC